MFCFRVSVQNLELSADRATCWKLSPLTFLMKLAKPLDLISYTLQHIGIRRDVALSRSNWASDSWKIMHYFSHCCLIDFFGKRLSPGCFFPMELVLGLCCSWRAATAAAAGAQLGLGPRATAFLVFSRHSLEVLVCPKITSFMVHKKVMGCFFRHLCPLRWIKPAWSHSPPRHCYWLRVFCSPDPAPVPPSTSQCRIKQSPDDPWWQSHSWGPGSLGVISQRKHR